MKLVARTMSDQEHLCEECHKVYATVIFDRRLLCDYCRAKLEKKLVRHG